MRGKGGGTLFALANHYIFTVKNKLGDIAVTTIYCYLFINNINVFKHLCVCVAACVRVFHKNERKALTVAYILTSLFVLYIYIYIYKKRIFYNKRIIK